LNAVLPGHILCVALLVFVKSAVVAAMHIKSTVYTFSEVLCAWDWNWRDQQFRVLWKL